MSGRDAHPAEEALQALGVRATHAAFILGDPDHGAFVLGDRSAASGSRADVDAQADQDGDRGRSAGPRTGRGHAGWAGDDFDRTGFGGE